MNYANWKREDLQKELSALQTEYQNFKAKNLSLDLSRGKPGAKQLDMLRERSKERFFALKF